eukprot:scaffold5048_cov102-Isochrysis_galbana.AAC.1
MSISSYASDLSAASHSHSCEIIQSTPSRQSGMVQPVVNEMFATVHAAGSSLLGLFTSCTTFDSTDGLLILQPTPTKFAEKCYQLETCLDGRGAVPSLSVLAVSGAAGRGGRIAGRRDADVCKCKMKE